MHNLIKKIININKKNYYVLILYNLRNLINFFKAIKKIDKNYIKIINSNEIKIFI